MITRYLGLVSFPWETGHLIIFLFSTKFLWILKNNSQVSPVDEKAADASQGLNSGVDSTLAHLAGTQAHKARDRRKQCIDFPNCYENVPA